jgi:hypothetical protein
MPGGVPVEFGQIDTGPVRRRKEPLHSQCSEPHGPEPCENLMPRRAERGQRRNAPGGS